MGLEAPRPLWPRLDIRRPSDSHAEVTPEECGPACFPPRSHRQAAHAGWGGRGLQQALACGLGSIGLQGGAEPLQHVLATAARRAPALVGVAE